jgi:hypothetical protein
LWYWGALKGIYDVSFETAMTYFIIVLPSRGRAMKLLFWFWNNICGYITCQDEI